MRPTETCEVNYCIVSAGDRQLVLSKRLTDHAHSDWTQSRHCRLTAASRGVGETDVAVYGFDSSQKRPDKVETVNDSELSCIKILPELMFSAGAIM